MGQARKVTIATREVEVPGSEDTVTVRGLSFEDLWTLAMDHGPEAAAVFTKFTKGEEFDEADVGKMVAGIIPQAPRLVAAVVALANDDYCPEAIDHIRKMSPIFLVRAVEDIFVLTVQSEAELKKFLESIVRMLGGLNSQIQQMKLPLSDLGFGDLGVK